MIRSHSIRLDGKETNKGMPAGIPLFHSLPSRQSGRHAGGASPPQRDQGRYARRANMGTGL